jgi:2-oxoglutarate ferredoxin oxidoreductase subunit gamma
MIQSFGPEARGSACSATLVLSEQEVLYPYIGRPDIFVVMSAEGYDKYASELRDDGVLVYEKDLVKATERKGQPAFGCPSTRIAEQLGRSIVQNIVMMGFFTGATEFVDREAMRRAVADSVPPGTEELNLRAFDAGLEYFDTEYGTSAKAARKKPAAGKKGASRAKKKTTSPAAG